MSLRHLGHAPRVCAAQPRRLLSCCTIVALTLLASLPAMGQDFRVYNPVTRLQHPSRRSEGKLDQSTLIACSLTYFHAGKVYDHIEEVGEVVIFEPTHHRFTILNGTLMTGTRIQFEELRQYLKVARTETEHYITSLPSQTDGRAIAEALRFQLQPKFETTFEERAEQLELDSPHVRYRVKTVEFPQKEIVETYLNYADWTSRLNYVLHPRAFYPACREALNNELRQRGRIPTRIDLTAELDEAVHLRAEHRFVWQLYGFDRQQIDKWERMTESNELNWVDFRQYQQLLLAGSRR